MTRTSEVQAGLEGHELPGGSTGGRVHRDLLSVLLAIVFTCLAIGVPAIAAESDPGLPGPYPVATSQYDFGYGAFVPMIASFPGPIEFRGSVTYPAGLADGPYPVVMILHGRHLTCYNPDDFSETSFDWPCGGGMKPIPNFRGYAYLAEHLASHGFIVVSISSNGIVARDLETFDIGLVARAELIYQHLLLWAIYNSYAITPFDNQFVGKIDLTRIARLGHSIGGDGVALGHYLNQLVGKPFGIEALLMLAPTDIVGIHLNDVALATVLPYCDAGIAPFGFVPGARYFDDVLYNKPGDTGAKHLLVTAGANHNYYNTIWTPEIFPAGADDDWLWAETFYGAGPDPECNPLIPGNGRLSAAEQRASLLPYATAFFLEYLGGPGASLPGATAGSGEHFGLLTGDSPPPSALTERIYATYHAPDDPSRRLDLNRLVDPQNLSINTLGDLALGLGLSEYSHCGGSTVGAQPCISVPGIFQPHAGVGQLKLAWDFPFTGFLNWLPAGVRDVSRFKAFQFRAGVNFEDPRNVPGQSQDFVVRLVDGAGRSAFARISDWSQSLYYPPGGLYPVTPRPLLNGVRIPLTAFVGVDLEDIRQVNFEFGNLPGYERGSILVSGLAFSQ